MGDSGTGGGGMSFIGQEDASDRLASSAPDAFRAVMQKPQLTSYTARASLDMIPVSPYFPPTPHEESEQGRTSKAVRSRGSMVMKTIVSTVYLFRGLRLKVGAQERDTHSLFELEISRPQVQSR